MTAQVPARDYDDMLADSSSSRPMIAASLHRLVQGLIQVGDDVLHVLDAHRYADEVGGNTCSLLLGRRHVDVRVLDEPWNWDYFVWQQKARA